MDITTKKYWDALHRASEILCDPKVDLDTKQQVINILKQSQKSSFELLTESTKQDELAG